MERLKTKDIEGAICVYTGAIMMQSSGAIDGCRGKVTFGWSIKEDRILINLMYDDISIISEVNSDHIQMMKEIIKSYEESFK